MAASCAVSGGGPVISPDLIKNSDPGSPWFTICKVKGGANFAINVPSRAISKDKLNFRIWRVKHEAFRFVLTQLGKATVEVHSENSLRNTPTRLRVGRTEESVLEAAGLEQQAGTVTMLKWQRLEQLSGRDVLTDTVGSLLLLGDICC